MRYKLDASGYVCAVSFGCYLDDCTEYTGAVPIGYNNLDEWASYSCIQAYYIDPNGNLVLDYSRKTEIENRQEQEAIDYSPVLRKDLYGTDEVLDSQYVRQTEKGKVILLEDIKTIAPRLKITGVNPLEYNKLSIYTQGKNMMPCNAVSTNIKGVTFTKNASGSLTVLGTATENIEYIIADGKATPIFALKSNQDYYLNLGGLKCELRFYDGETTAQQYSGASGLLNLPQNIEVTQVVIKIASGDSVNITFYPQLECGNKFTSYDPHKCKSVDIDFSKYVSEIVLPSDTLYPEDTLYPGLTYNTIDYILIENGKITISVNDEIHVLGIGSVGLFSTYSTIYATKDVELEIEYSLNKIDVDSLAFLQGKSTTTNQFKILQDGSIEAHNGFFSGRIEADSGYFKGEVSWKNIIDTEGVATKEYVEDKEYQTASQVTEITKNTVTTEYVNALNIKAGSVDAENITGNIISGKKLQGVTGDFKGEITATSGEIGGFTIGTNSIYSDNKASLLSTVNGVYIGKDGISVGGKYGIKIDRNGEVMISGNGSIEFSNSLITTKITSDKISVSNNFIDKDKIHCGGLTSLYTEIENNEIKMHGVSGYLHINSNETTWASSGTYYLKDNYSNNLMAISNSSLSLVATSLNIGNYSGSIGFFGATTKSKKKTVATVSTTATVSTVATKLNELINALKAYNLIG